ncbi:hypothetical protein PRIPAC_74962, partial [Pristionchus pacificus]|uniref:Uncharacterized protein n=1 Tax=Pristionchus pacificus TaxID=54126 RepID=A0A2A6CG98_PRIPA
YAYVRMIAVLRGYRRLGVASLLLDEASAALRVLPKIAWCACVLRFPNSTVIRIHGLHRVAQPGVRHGSAVHSHHLSATVDSLVSPFEKILILLFPINIYNSFFEY